MGVFEELCLPPSPVDGICPTCRGVNYTSNRQCAECDAIAATLGTVLGPAWPISIYVKPSPLRDWLTYYKPNMEAPVDVEAGALLAELLYSFIDYLATTLDEQFDAMTVVPSSTREPPHPLERLLREQEMRWPLDSCLVRTTEPLAHNAPSRHAYEVTKDVRGRRVLVVDDVYTTGARAQSARYALVSAGAIVPPLIVIGRRLNREYHDRAQQLWDELKDQPFDFPTLLARLTG